MKRFLAAASLLLLAACSPSSTTLGAARLPEAEAAAIPQGRTPEERRQVFSAAVALYAAGDVDGAQRLFLSSVETYPELADHALRYLAEIAAARHDDAAALERWRALREHHPDSVWRGEAALRIGEAELRAGHVAGAEPLLAEAGSLATDPVVRASALWLSSRAARAAGDAGRARALATELRSKYPASPQAREAVEEAWSERETALATVAGARAEIELLLSEGEPARALELAREAEGRFRGSAAMPDLWLLEAQALRRTGALESSIALLERLRARFPRHPAAAQALFRLASIAWNRDDDDAALRFFDAFVARYPRADEAAEALYSASRIRQEAGRFAEAARGYERLARAHPRSPLAAEAEWRVGWCHYRSGEAAKASARFARLAARASPESAAALYWEARSSEKIGRDGRAYVEVVDKYPESYYAMLAERRLGRADGSALAGRVPPPAAPVVDPPTSNDPHLVRFEELRLMQLKPLARMELGAYARAAAPPPGEWLMGAWVSIDGYREAVRAAAREGCALDRPSASYCYPLGFWDAVRRSAERLDLDPFLVAALIRQESLFDAAARSSAGARGLMQLIPSTASRVSRDLGRTDFRAEMLDEPQTNIELGTAELKQLLDQYRADLPRALAAYNAGKAAVAKWESRFPRAEDDEFVEAISFRETRAYVKRVLQNRRIYRALYGAPTRDASSGAAAAPSRKAE